MLAPDAPGLFPPDDFLDELARRGIHIADTNESAPTSGLPLLDTLCTASRIFIEAATDAAPLRFAQGFDAIALNNSRKYKEDSAMSTTLPERKDVPVEHTWDTASVFPSDEAWEQAFEER